MKIQVHNKFYIYQQVLCLVLDLLFGQDFSKFNLETELINAEQSRTSETKVLHVLTQAHLSQIMTVTDLDLSVHHSYKDVEIVHKLCSYAMIKRTGVATLHKSSTHKMLWMD